MSCVEQHSLCAHLNNEHHLFAVTRNASQSLSDFYIALSLMQHCMMCVHMPPHQTSVMPMCPSPKPVHHTDPDLVRPKVHQKFSSCNMSGIHLTALCISLETEVQRRQNGASCFEAQHCADSSTNENAGCRTTVVEYSTTEVFQSREICKSLTIRACFKKERGCSIASSLQRVFTLSSAHKACAR